MFTRNASEAINLVAYSWALHNLKPGDEVELEIEGIGVLRNRIVKEA